MKKNGAPVVHCEYAKAEKSLSQLLEESFRLYLARTLASAGRNAASWGNERPLFQGGKDVPGNQ